MDPFVIGDDSFQEVERPKTTNALYLSSLRTPGLMATRSSGCIPTSRRQCLCDRE